MSSGHQLFLTFKPPLIIAHRGSRIIDQYPENTLPAFVEAQRLAAQGIELDIRLTLNGELVVFHDRSMLRLTGLNRTIDRCSSGFIQNIKFIGFEDQEKINIPLLQEVFEKFGKNFFYNIEIKQQWGSYKKLIRKLHLLLQEYDLLEQVWLSSFDARFLWEWRRYDREVGCAFLFNKWNIFIRQICPRDFIDFLHPAVTLLPKISELGYYSKPLCFWTVNQANEIGALSSWPVFALITDNIPLVKRILF
jgi:glycerophosphoryl diester phosphodiesterase